MSYIFRRNDCLSCAYEFSQTCSCEYLRWIDIGTGVCEWTTFKEWAWPVDDDQLALGLSLLGYRKEEVEPDWAAKTTVIPDREIPKKRYTGIIKQVFKSHNGRLVKIGRNRTRRKNKATKS